MQISNFRHRHTLIEDNATMNDTILHVNSVYFKEKAEAYLEHSQMYFTVDVRLDSECVTPKT